MYIRLKQKPFYFLTDRDTRYIYLIENHPQQQPKRHLYLPTHFQTQTAAQLRAQKWSLVQKLMYWSLFNSSKMTVADSRICHSKVVDLAATFLGGLICGSFFRRALFRIEFPFLEMALQGSTFSVRWIKSMAAYTAAALITYNTVGAVMKEEYLVDLALEYKYNFVKKNLPDSEVEVILDRLCEERFGSRHALRSEQAG